MFPAVLVFGVNGCPHCAHGVIVKGTVSLLRNAKAPSLRNDGAFYLGINRGFVSPLLARVEPGGARLRWLCAPSLITKKMRCPEIAYVPLPRVIGRELAGRHDVVSTPAERVWVVQLHVDRVAALVADLVALLELDP